MPTLTYLVAEFPEILPATARPALRVTGSGFRFGPVLEGRRSQETGLAVGATNAYPHLRHLVFSRTLGASPDPAVDVLARDPVAAIRNLKQQPGPDLWLVGGGKGAGYLYDEIDELVLKLSPAIIGACVPLFGGRGRFGPQWWQRRDVVLLPAGVDIASFTRVAEAVPE